MFHIELRQFPHVAREFNIAEADLRSRIVAPWLAGRQLEFGERKWAPERARLTIYEGPQLRTDEIAMGRGWSNATRSGQDVTARMLDAGPGGSASGEALKRDLLEGAMSSPLTLKDAVALAAAMNPGRRASESLAAAEQAIWELLHAGQLELHRDGVTVDRANWESTLLAWETWSGGDEVRIVRPTAM
jgi:hypothetical protein